MVSLDVFGGLLLLSAFVRAYYAIEVPADASMWWRPWVEVAILVVLGAGLILTKRIVEQRTPSAG